MSYDYQPGRDCEERALGRTWKFSRFTRNVWIELAKEGRRLMPDPIAVAMEAIDAFIDKDAQVLRRLRQQDEEEASRAKAEGRNPILIAGSFTSLSEGLERRAYEKKTAYLSAGSPELQLFIMSPEGQSYLLFLLLKKYQPEIDIDTAYDVYRELAVVNGQDGRMTVEDIITTCNGRSPEPAKNEASPA